MEKYDLILSDPPWEQRKGGTRKCRPFQGVKLDYPTLPLSEIMAIHAGFMKYAADDHLFFLWTIDKFLHDSEHMMAELGYRLHARLIWNKANGVAPCFSVRFSHEYLLFLYRGKFRPVASSEKGKIMTVFEERPTGHSRKPKISYGIIERLYPNARKLELFARRERAGWDAWGNEVENAVSFEPEKTEHYGLVQY